RLITNASTGRTGAGIADRLASGGHEVVLLRSAASAPAPAGCREETFSSYGDLDGALARILSSGRFDAVIHAAAVSDFGVAEVVADGSARPPCAGKLETGSAPVIRLRPLPKLVDSLRARSLNKSVRIVAFKLTAGGGREAAEGAVASLFAHSAADLVVHNSLAERAGPDEFPSEIHFPDGRQPERCATRTELAAALERILAGTPAPGAAPS
ncbi:MAG TPA: phosphopantothenoylcysteine decarboxylase, partial [Opitutaceae bacterium]|nr:phosphopantothenoylcysteine decarboxylase [Opitutaceae bacterium]